MKIEKSKKIPNYCKIVIYIFAFKLRIVSFGVALKPTLRDLLLTVFLGHMLAGVSEEPGDE